MCLEVSTSRHENLLLSFSLTPQTSTGDVSYYKPLKLQHPHSTITRVISILMGIESYHLENPANQTYEAHSTERLSEYISQHVVSSDKSYYDILKLIHLFTHEMVSYLDVLRSLDHQLSRLLGV